MRLEKVYVNGEVLYREIPEEGIEESTEEKEQSEKPTHAPSLPERAKRGVNAVLENARSFGKRLEEGADRLGKRICEGVHSVFPRTKGKQMPDEQGALIDLLPHLDAKGRHEVYLKLCSDRARLDRAQLGALLPYLEKEDFDALCRLYRDEND